MRSIARAEKCFFAQARASSDMASGSSAQYLRTPLAGISALQNIVLPL